MKWISALEKAGAELFEVGGMVRDQLLGRATTDIDYISRKLPVETLIALLKPFGKVTLVGKSFGVVKFSPHNEPETVIDIALPRKEFSTGQGHRDFDVAFDPELSVEEDLGRRDFTINAMARRVATGELIDPFHGEEDLKARQLRMVFPKAFEEDPLRMLRAIQFAARLDFTLEPETFAAIQRHLECITTVSAERVIEELRKLLAAPKPSIGFQLMHEAGLLELIIPELEALKGIEQDKQPGNDAFDHTMRVVDAARIDPELLEPGEINLMFAALFHDVGKAKTRRYHPPSKRIVFFGHQIVSARMAKKWMGKYRVETIGVDPKLVLNLVENHMFETKATFTDKAIRRFIAKVGKEVILKLLDLRFADNRGGKHPHGVKGVLRLRKIVHGELERKTPFGPKDLKVTGHDLMEIGIPAGPQMGKVIQGLVEIVLDHPELNEREQLLEIASKKLESRENWTLKEFADSLDSTMRSQEKKHAGARKRRRSLEKEEE